MQKNESMISNLNHREMLKRLFRIRPAARIFQPTRYYSYEKLSHDVKKYCSVEDSKFINDNIRNTQCECGSASDCEHRRIETKFLIPKMISCVTIIPLSILESLNANEPAFCVMGISMHIFVAWILNNFEIISKERKPILCRQRMLIILNMIGSGKAVEKSRNEENSKMESERVKNLNANLAAVESYRTRVLDGK